MDYTRASATVATSSRLRDLFERLVDLSPQQQSEFLLEQEVSGAETASLAALLAADIRQGAIFETPAADWVEQLEVDPADPAALVGRKIGAYCIVELLGQGGSSVVCRATRTVGDATQMVALKLLHNGLFSAESRRRFRREQQILAQLTHPNIARFIDGGISEDGTPYIAMEVVDGLDLITYAEVHALDRVGRLRLLEKVCRAVDAAHRALIVHRDLKPSNVLVDATGEVKVLDFGISRLLDDGELLTATQDIVLTPGYAAPEQYSGCAVTTASDVYALGVLAGKLLIGEKLGADATWLENEAGKRSEARRRWRELDAELSDMLRAMLASDQRQRYSSAGHVADDVSRYLRNEPITVTAPTLWYRFRKFFARHRGSVAATACLLVLIAASLCLAIWQAGVAHQEAGKTREELLRANAMRDYMFDTFARAEPSVPRESPTTVVEVVERAIATLRSDRAGISRARIELLTRLAGVLNAQGKLGKAKELLDWLSARSATTAGADDQVTLEVEKAKAWNAVLRGEFTTARAILDELLTRTASDDTTALRSRLLMDSATLATKERALTRARAEARSALQMIRLGGDADLLRSALDAYGNVLLTVGDVDESIPVFQEQLRLALDRYGNNHVVVAEVQASLSRAYRGINDLDRAEESARAALKIDRAVYASADWHTAQHINALSQVLMSRRDYTSALALEKEGLAINIAALGKSHPEVLGSLNNIGYCYFMMGEFSNAVAPLRESLAQTVKEYGPEHSESALERGNYGYSLAMSGDVAAGVAELDHAVATFSGLSDADPDRNATAMEKRIRVAIDQKDLEGLLARIDRIEDVLRTYKPDNYWDGRVELLRGAALLLLRRPEDARKSLDGGEKALSASAHPSAVLVVECVLLRAIAARDTGDLLTASALASEGRRLLKALPYPAPRLLAMANELPRDASIESNRERVPPTRK